MKNKKLVTVLVVFAMMITTVFSVIAANVPETTVNTATININKKLEPSAGGFYPETDTFQFKLEPVSYTLASDGVVVADPDATYMPAGTTIDVKVEDHDNDPLTAKIGSASTDLEFKYWENEYVSCSGGANVYKRAGVYTYKLTEIAPTDTTVSYDPETYYVNIYLVQQVDENNVPVENPDGYGYSYDELLPTTIQSVTAWQGTNMTEEQLQRLQSDWTGELVSTDSADDGKFAIGTNEVTYPFDNSYATTTSLKLQKNINGNYSDLNKQFEFEITIDDGLNAATPANYDIVFDYEEYLDYSWSEVRAMEEAGITSGTPITVKLAHTQNITISGLPSGTTYTIVEKQAPTYVGEYTITDGGTGKTESAEAGVNLTATGTLSDNGFTDGVLTGEEVVFTNTKEVSVPTGIALSALPYVIGVATFTIAFVIIKNKKKEEQI
ncbi:MAG: hypothetical protein J6A15_09680 [Clostridia bacterium]|nr:hypothetical protein [Clostridia bacterium]